MPYFMLDLIHLLLLAIVSYFSVVFLLKALKKQPQAVQALIIICWLMILQVLPGLVIGIFFNPLNH
jgi:hypothetical protein